MSDTNIDWNALQFTCNKAQEPPFDEESDRLFQRARALERADNPANDTEMIHLYQQAAKFNHYKAILNLARLYARGTGVKVDERKAVDLVEKAMKMQSAHAYYTMGVMLHQGIGVREDRIAALRYFRRSADMGNPYGQQVTGEDIRDAFVKQTESNKRKGYLIAVQMLECSLSQGLAESGYKLGLHFLVIEKDKAKALEYFQKAVVFGHEKSLYMLYSIFNDEEDGIAKDPLRAACYNRRWKELKSDPNKQFPNIDQLCPLPLSVSPH